MFRFCRLGFVLTGLKIENQAAEMRVATLHYVLGRRDPKQQSDLETPTSFAAVASASSQDFHLDIPVKAEAIGGDLSTSVSSSRRDPHIHRSASLVNLIGDCG
ncbi:unnamed protein product [Arabidopsis lyrata]|nr:unnamed protein product [Arabidopsis lyrata]